jgi:formiminotetrahydrofolate cyclodeaminase
MMNDLPISQFLENVAKGTPTPGGGSVAALAGSLGASLVEMVVHLTLGKKGFAQHEEALQKIGQEARSLRQALASTIQEDVNAYQAVMAAYLLPKETEEEKKKRREKIQKALRIAADPPLFTAATSLKVLKLCEEVIEKGNPRTLTDAAVGVLMAHGALMGGLFNVLTNLSALEDAPYVEKIRKELKRLKTEGENLTQELMSRIQERLSMK